MSPVHSYIYHADCYRVVDGDTIDCRVDLGFRMFHDMRLRLLGIDTYEINSSDPEERKLAQLAKLFVVEAILADAIKIETHKSDSFGRWLANVWYMKDGVEYNLNQQLLDEGLAKVYKK